MKKILVCLLVLLTLAMGTAYAEKTKYKMEGYDFKAVKVVRLVSSKAPAQTATDAYYPAAAPVDKVLNYLRADLPDRGLKFWSGNGAQAPNPASPFLRKNKGTKDLTVNVYKMGYDKTWKAPWDETRTEQEKRVAQDENGKDIIVYEPVEKVIHHDGEWEYQCYADVEFIVTDSRTGQMVYSCRDTRDRSGQDYDGMLGRICKDFAKDIAKN